MISVVTRRRRRPFTFATGATRTPTFRTTPIIGATRATIAFGPRWTQLVQRHLAVAVFVELLQRFAGVGDFLLVKHAIVVHVESGHQGRRRGALSVPARPAGNARAFTTWRALASWRRAASILCCRHPRRRAEREQHDSHFVCGFHF